MGIQDVSKLQLGKFKVVRRIGRGGMGAVYEGYDPSLDRRVAIKTLVTEAISDGDSRRRFEREARAAAKLQHPNIVTVYELGNFDRDEKPYIVMEYLGGSDMSSLIEDERGIPFVASLDIAAQLCHALDFAHQHEIVHRDVKPSNVRYLEDGRAKIMDFGIARMGGTSQITRSGVMVGTLHYMSPEQIRGIKVDGRSDVFSMGCILYEALTGKRPFEADSPTGTLYLIVNEQPPSILEVCPDIPEPMQDILIQALAKEPDDRFRTAREMAQKLEELLEVHRRSFPRPTAELQSRLSRLEDLQRDRQWKELIPLAEELYRERPDMVLPWRALVGAIRELGCEEAEEQATDEERMLHLSEISKEMELLWPYGTPGTGVGASDPTRIPDSISTAAHVQDAKSVATRIPEVVSAAARIPGASDLSIESPVHEPAEKKPRGLPAKWLWIAAVGLVLAMAAVLGRAFLPEFLSDSTLRQAIRISSDPGGSAVFLNGVDQSIVTGSGAPVELAIEGAPGDTFVIELRKQGYETALSTIALGSDPLPPLDVSLQPVLRRLTIRTDPPGASVLLNGEELGGRTPFDVELSPLDEHRVVLSREGYSTYSLTIPSGGGLPTDTIVLSAAVVPTVGETAPPPETVVAAVVTPTTGPNTGDVAPEESETANRAEETEP